MESTASCVEKKKFALQKNDVIFTKDSETADEIAISAVVISELPNLVCGYHLGIARPKTINGKYLGVAFNSYSVKRQFFRLANGTTRFGLNLSSMAQIRIPILPAHKQKSIARMSVDHAKEEQLMKEQVDLLVKQKRGLMQQLLTGKLKVKVAA